jgi:hypothetical protein
MPPEKCLDDGDQQDGLGFGQRGSGQELDSLGLDPIAGYW